MFVPPALAHESPWTPMTITSFLGSALTFQVRELVVRIIAVLLRDHLPNDSPPLSPHALMANDNRGDQEDHDDNSSASKRVPSFCSCLLYKLALQKKNAIICRAKNDPPVTKIRLWASFGYVD